MIIAFLKPNPFHHKFRKGFNDESNIGGEYNGYVAFDKNLPLSWQGGMDWSEENTLDRLIDVHGGITLDCPMEEFMDDPYIPLTPIPDREELKKLRVIGFDTLHCDDTREKWPKEAIIEETLRLMEQIKAL
jgi:hypothetical protein